MYINSLSKATKSAVGNAILAVQQGLSYVLVENQTYGGATQMGYFYAVVTMNGGVPGSTLLNSITNAVDAVRPITSTFGVFAAVTVNANIAMTITTSSGYVHATVVSQVQAALQAYIATLSIGQTLAYTRLAQVAYDASPGVTGVSAITLNGGTSDLTATQQQLIVSGTLSIT
ncbi:MAG: hypothetical protein CPSOU_1989 [uncultured Paraburkholderia sp.]|nr:MAG: hypothetical protein CPSOU_1989 [uncultured Paraburkholderia sp.]